MYKKWTEDDEIYLEHLMSTQEDVDYYEVAEFLNTSYKSVIMKCFRMRQINKNLKGARNKFSKEENEYLRSGYALGISRTDMAAHLNRSKASIDNRIAKLKLAKRVRLRTLDKEIRELASQGLWQAEIARRLNISTPAISNYVNKHNIKCEPAPPEVMEEIKRRLSNVKT